MERSCHKSPSVSARCSGPGRMADPAPNTPACTPDVQAALRETRRIDWNKWVKFNAGIILTDEEVRQLTEAGCEICPIKWVDTDKNAYQRRDNDYVSVPAKYKSRLVGCENFETTEGLRTDSPAGDVDSHNIVGSWCAQAHVSIHSCDFTNGGFQGQEIDRILLYRIPPEGIPEEGIAGGEILASRVPVYSKKDAGRGLWLRLKNTFGLFKCSLNQILPTLFTLRDEESRIIAVMSSNVDDLLYGNLPEGAEAANSLLQQFLVGKQEHGNFRFCGKEFRQDEDLGIHVTAKDNTERIQPITYETKHGLTRKAAADEVHQLRSVTQSLAWIARQTRPDLSYRISKVQSTFENACVRDSSECNRIVEYAASTSTRGF